MITARYVLAIKSSKDKEKKYKARYVAEGHLGIMKNYLIQGAQAIQCVSVRIQLVIAKAKRFRVWVVDVKLAYRQTDKPLIRKVFIMNSASELNLSPQECLELLKPNCG